MFNNSTNINKANNHLSPSLTEHKKTMIYDIGNQVLAGDRHKSVAGLMVVCTIFLFVCYSDSQSQSRFP
jgi:hypothetical protein